MASDVNTNSAGVEHADWRQPLEALAAWIYRLYPETNAGQANPWPGKAPMRTWWTGMSPDERRKALTIDDPGVIAMAVSLCRVGSAAHFEIDAYRRRPPLGAVCGDRMTLSFSQHRFRLVRAYADESVTEGKASKFIVSQSLLRIDISQFMARDVASIFSALDDQPCHQWNWQMPRYDVLGPKQLQILGAKDASLSAFEIVDAIAGGRAFSIPCKSESAEDPWCRISWYRAEQERGVTVGHFLANLTEVLMWRKFWRDHNMSRRQRPRHGPRLGPQAHESHRENSDAKLDAWWTGLDGSKRRSVLQKAIACHSFRLMAATGRNLSRQFTHKNAVCALVVLSTCVEAAVDVSRDLISGSSSPSSLSKTPIECSESAIWFRAALRFGVEEVRCHENSEALINFEERGDGRHTFNNIAVARTGRVKARKRRAKKILKAAVLASPPPRASPDTVARTPVSFGAVLCETRCDLDQAAATIARRWRRYSSSDGLARRCRSDCSRDVDSRHRRSSTGPYTSRSVDDTSEQRSCPPSPSRHRSVKNCEVLGLRDLSQSTESGHAHDMHQTSEYDSSVNGTFGQCGPCTPSSGYVEQQHSAKDSRGESGLVAVVSCSTSSRGEGEKTSSTSSEKRLVHGAAKLQPVEAPGVHKHCHTTSNLRLKKKERSPGAFDLSKTAEIATSYSEALRRNIDTEVNDLAARHSKSVHLQDHFAKMPLLKQCPTLQAQSHFLLHRPEQQRDAQVIHSDAAGRKDENCVMSGLQAAHPGEEHEHVIWRLARANLTLRRENLKLQAEVCRLYTELSAHRGGKATSLSSYISPPGNETAQQPYPRVIPLNCGDKAASVSSERVARPRRIPAAMTVDDGWPVFRGSVPHTFSASHNQSVRRGSSSDAVARRRIHEPEQTQRVLGVGTSRYSPPQPSLHNGLGAPTVGYYYYIWEKQAGFFDVASDDGRLTIRSDTSPAYPHHQSGPKPLQAVRECAVLLPSSQQHAACVPQQRSPNVAGGRPQFVLDSVSRESSSALCDNNHARIMTDSIDDIAGSSDEFSQSSSEENRANEEDDDKWATTTTRGSGKPPSLARANLSLDDELPDDLLSASSHSSLAFSNREEHGQNGECPNQGNEACSSHSLRRISELRNREAGVSPAGINLQNENSARENGRALAQRAPTPPNHGGDVNEVDRHVSSDHTTRVAGMSTVSTAITPAIESLRQHRKPRSCKCVLVDESLFSASSRLADDIRAFAEKVSRRQRSRESAWRAARELVRNVVKSLWPRARVEPYGSCVTRLSLADKSSDLDLVIRLPRVRVATPAMTPGDLEGRNAIKETWPQELARRLRSEDWVDTSSVRTIASAFVPIVKLVTVQLGETSEAVRLDVSFETPWHRGLDANRLILRMLDDMPAVRPLLLVLKKHAAERGLNASYTGGLSSYALTLLVVRYLQEQPSKDLDPAALLLGFFDFYAHRTFHVLYARQFATFSNRWTTLCNRAGFDAGKTGISVGRACFFSRAELGSRHYAAAAGYAIGDNHQVASRANCLARSFHFDPLYVEDPLGPGNNVGRNCFRIAQIQRTWSDALCAITDAIAKNSRPIYKGIGPELRRPNLLCSIISLPDEYDASLHPPNNFCNVVV